MDSARRTLILGAAGGLILFLLTAAGPATQPSAGKVMAGRDTPAGAMNVFEMALDDGDLATTIDSYHMPADLDLSFRRSWAHRLIAIRQFTRAVTAHFGAADARTIFTQTRIPKVELKRPFTDSTWKLMPGETNYARATTIPDPLVRQSEFMTRDPDGIWRMGAATGVVGPPPGMALQAEALAVQLDAGTLLINQGKSTTPDAIVHAIYPQGAPASPSGRRMVAPPQQPAQNPVTSVLELPLEIPGAMIWGMAEKQAEQEQAAQRAKEWQPTAPTAQTFKDAQPPKTIAVPATRPNAGASVTPALAFRDYEDALERGDVNAAMERLAPSAPPDDSYRRALALKAIAERRYYRAVETWFGAATANHVCFYAGVSQAPTIVTEQDWSPIWGHSDGMRGRISPPGVVGAEPARPMMQKGPDGRWRIEPERAFMGAPRATDDAISTAAHLNWAADGVETGKFADVAGAIGAVKLREDIQPLRDKPGIEVSTDRTTVDGAWGYFVQGIEKRDAAALTKLFYAGADPAGRLAGANAQRIVLALKLKDAVNAKFDRYGRLLTARFGLIAQQDHPEWGAAFMQIGVQSTTAVEETTGANCKLIDGCWRVDITPARARTPAEAAAAMERDNAAIRVILDQVSSGACKKPGDVRDALVSAKLSAVPDADFASNDFRLPEELK